MPAAEPGNDRDATIALIRKALRERSGKAWSVTGGRGTAWGWIHIQAPPARCTWGWRLKEDAKSDRPEDYEGFDTGQPGGSMTPTDSAELAQLLGLERPVGQYVGIPSGGDYYAEYIDRAKGRTPTKYGKQYWD